MTGIHADSSTIAAIATPMGSGGIGIIKISGKESLSIAASLFCGSDSLADNSQDTASNSIYFFKPRRLHHGHIVDSESGRVLDEVLLAVMPAPHSYTREDVVEIQSHAGAVVLSSILGLVLKKGARLAAPGEFTKRAYLNGRIDLTQAEAVIDIINARTAKALEIATAQIKGDLRSSIESIRDPLLQLLAEVEGAIDFPDDVGEIIDADSAIEGIENKVINKLEDLVNRYKNAHVLRDGLKLIVVGKPNVGKSSLMNRLIKKDRVIVASSPGTTRDLIEETLNIRGIPVIITDTAGLHETDDPVESIGIRKTHEHISGSDLILFMVDVSCPLTENDYKIYEMFNNKSLILVMNKSDLVYNGFKPEIPDSWNTRPRIMVSALYNRGLNELKDLIAKVAIGEGALNQESTIIPNLRHKLALEQSFQAVSSAVEGIRRQSPFELIAIDIREALDALGDIIGLSAREDVLDQIFSRFCIGK
jgi:tRNA modification GTPase